MLHIPRKSRSTNLDDLRRLHISTWPDTSCILLASMVLDRHLLLPLLADFAHSGDEPGYDQAEGSDMMLFANTKAGVLQQQYKLETRCGKQIAGILTARPSSPPTPFFQSTPGCDKMRWCLRTSQMTSANLHLWLGSIMGQRLASPRN